MDTPFFRTIFNYDRDAASRDSSLRCLDESRTRQADSVDADINVIMKRYTQTGILPVVDRVPLNSDFPDGMDFRMAQDLIAQGRQAFQALPADVRSRFQNEPAQFVDFCSDPDNLPQLRKWGLAKPLEAAAEPAGDPAASSPSRRGKPRSPASTEASEAPSTGSDDSGT